MLPHTTRCAFVRTLALLALLAGPALADVLHVPSQFATIQAAVDASAVGDIVIVSPGVYAENVLLNRGVTIASAAPGAVELQHVEISGVVKDEVVILQGLRIDARGALPFQGDGFEEAVDAQHCGGAVRVQDCDLLGEWGSATTASDPFPDGFPALRATGCASVALLNSTATGGDGSDILDAAYQELVGNGGAGVQVEASAVAIIDCELTGGAGGTVSDALDKPAGHGGDALDNQGGSVFAAACELGGGDGGDASCDVPGGLCGAGGSGGDGAGQDLANASLATRDNLYTPGVGGLGGDGVAAPDGSEIDILAGASTVFDALMVTATATTPVQENAVSSMTFTGPHGTFVWLLVSLEPGHQLKTFHQGVYLNGSFLLAVPLGAIVSGPLEVSFHVPDLGAGVPHITAFLQVLQDVPTPGAPITLDAALSLALLDAGP